MKYFDIQKSCGSHPFCPPGRGWEQKRNSLLYFYLGFEWSIGNTIRGNTTDWHQVVLPARMDCLVHWHNSVLNIDISSVVTKYYILCYYVDSNRKMPVTSKNDNCFREKEEGMILQVWQWGVKTVLLLFHLFVNTYIYITNS